jgi:hypothetical protein
VNWIGDVVEHLARSRRAGATFDDAWSAALREFPPRGRDVGVWRPTLLPEPGGEVSVVEFFRVAAEDAWYGRRPVLRHFDARALRGDVQPV